MVTNQTGTVEIVGYTGQKTYLENTWVGFTLEWGGTRPASRAVQVVRPLCRQQKCETWEGTATRYYFFQTPRIFFIFVNLHKKLQIGVVVTSMGIYDHLHIMCWYTSPPRVTRAIPASGHWRFFARSRTPTSRSKQAAHLRSPVIPA